ncbi:E3 ubiquitin-protein ligase HECW1 [Astathelohania contejeani]|uniref:HECT-type E3 ubiquitin transferase n=1 Tax=Astathelohania contejeani TaxID=164912 RepID=A0ABQ7HZ81_9MICR|nr:E3 ubiquitin-protein ligase HECW1 [Thelohania contejeani]
MFNRLNGSNSSNENYIVKDASSNTLTSNIQIKNNKKCKSIASFYKKINEKNNKIYKIETVDYKTTIDHLSKINTSFKETNLNLVFYNTRNTSYNTNQTNKWLTIAFIELIKKENLLFNCSGINNNIYEPNIFSKSALEKSSDKLQVFGIIIGLFLKYHSCLPYKLPTYFFKLLLDLAVNKNDIMGENYQITKQLNDTKLFLHRKPDNKFAMSTIKKVQLDKEGNLIKTVYWIKNKFFTKKTYKTYVKQMIEYAIPKLRITVAEIKKGFIKVINQEDLNILTAKKLKKLINGSDKELNLNYWKTHANYLKEDGNSNVIKWFWEFIAEYTEKEIREIFFLFTGCKYIPYNNYINSILYLNIIITDINECSIELYSKILRLPRKITKSKFKASFKKMINSLVLENE